VASSRRGGRGFEGSSGKKVGKFVWIFKMIMMNFSAQDFSELMAQDFLYYVVLYFSTSTRASRCEVKSRVLGIILSFRLFGYLQPREQFGNVLLQGISNFCLFIKYKIY
jgi:hypothetical protein